MQKAISTYRRFPRWALYSGIAGMAGIIAMMVFSLVSEYRGDTGQARIEAENITQVLEGHAMSVFGMTDLLLREVLRNVRPADMKPGRSSSSRRQYLDALLKSQAESMPEVAVIHVADTRGNYIYSSLEPIPPVNISDRDYFKRQKAATAATSEPVISPPLVSRTTGKWTIILSRRVNFEDGSFAGIVLVILNLDYFRQFYQTLDLGGHGLVALYDNDLRLAARYPSSEKDMGKTANLVNARAFLDQGLALGTYNAKSALDGIERLFAFRRVGNLPFIVFAGIAREEYLADWRAHTWQYSIVAAIFSLLVFSFIMLQRRAEAALRDSDIKSRADEEEIMNLAFYDPLTHLPNRRLLMDRLKQAWIASSRYGREGALLFIDLDNFKSLNDTLGHQFGDMLLQQVAQRLVASVRKTDTVARLGGDEFVVMLEELGKQDLEAVTRVELVGNKILAAIGQPYHLSTHVYHCTASIGATLVDNRKRSADELMKQADIAMYQAKKAGRNALRFFYPEMQEVISSRTLLGNELRKALENRQFQLHYQVQVDSSYRAIGAEALIRWIHPERGLIPPAEFIPLAEETGLILSIGQWVLETACAQIKAWQNDALTRDLALAINVSARQFLRDDFADQVKIAVRQHAIDPARLKLELTESMLLENIEGTVATMNALNGIGVQFSLDDFGTGYSSLQYLKRLPLDQLKIDQSFVRDLATDASDKAIVVTVIAIARSLALEVIAEGVETEEQRQFLYSNGCIQYQGYLFGKPVPIEQFEASLKQG